MNSHRPCSQVGRHKARMEAEATKRMRTKHSVDLKDNLPALLWLPSQSSGICAEGLVLLQHLMAQHPGLERSQKGVVQCP